MSRNQTGDLYETIISPVAGAVKQKSNFEEIWQEFLKEREELFDQMKVPDLDRVSARIQSTFALMERRQAGDFPNGLVMKIEIIRILDELERKTF